jgi:predicted DsbA family dithiol-disulfide isomerase
MHASSEPLVIDVVSDLVCPWCFIGKRHLEAALAGLPAAAGAKVRWHPFELNPDLPVEGVDRKGYLEAKFGGPARAAEIYARVREAGVRAGLDFAFEAIARQPNTRDAHRLIAWAQSRGDAGPLVERLFRAYFLEGRYLGDRDLLAVLAAEAGCDADAARVWLESGLGADEIAEAEARVRALGISGVPFYIFDGRLGLSGAQPPETIREAIAQARAAATGSAGG